MTVHLSLAQRAGEWSITGLDDGDLGPYQTRADAESDRRGVARFYRHEAPKGPPQGQPLPSAITQGRADCASLTSTSGDGAQSRDGETTGLILTTDAQ